MKTKQTRQPEEKEGTVFNPKVVGDGYRVRFEYEQGQYFECMLEKDGTLSVRASGRHSHSPAHRQALVRGHK